MFLAVFELAVAVLAFWFFITQIVLPVGRRTPMFPIFRREAKLQQQLEGVNQRVVEKKIESEIETVKKEKGV